MSLFTFQTEQNFGEPTRCSYYRLARKANHANELFLFATTI